MGPSLCPAAPGGDCVSTIQSGTSLRWGRVPPNPPFAMLPALFRALFPSRRSPPPCPGPTSTRSKAEGVPPRCTWPRTVTRVSKPRRCTTSCGAERPSGRAGSSHGQGSGWRCRGGPYVLHVVGGDGLAVAVDGALGDDDDVEPRPSAARLAWGGGRKKKHVGKISVIWVRPRTQNPSRGPWWGSQGTGPLSPPRASRTSCPPSRPPEGIRG